MIPRPVPAIAFDGVSFHVSRRPPRAGGARPRASMPGDVLALVGRSGAGKSTLLRLVNRLPLPDRGEVHVEGRADAVVGSDRAAAAHRLRAAGRRAVPASDRRREHRLLGRVAGWTERAHRDAASRNCSTLVSLPADLAGRWPDEISGGQRQRVGVARALAARPADPADGRAVRRARSRHAPRPASRVPRASRPRSARPSCIVTHDLREALALADRIGVLDGGALVGAAARRRELGRRARTRSCGALARDARRGLTEPS